MSKKTIRDIDVSGKRVLVRVDFNVPLDEKGEITDDTRIRAALPTLKYLLDHGASLVVMSHLGRPKGQVAESLRMNPVADRLSELLGLKVMKMDQVVGGEAEKTAASLEPGQVMLLENLRFDPGETSNDPQFAAALARLGDIYVDDAFGAAHREHASVVGIAKLLPSVAGFLMENEVSFLQGLLKNPARPFVAILGGSKISDKLKVIGNFQDLVDTLLIGGGMTFTLMKADGMSIGKSIVEDDMLEQVEAMIAQSGAKRATMILPEDLVVADDFKADANNKVVEVSFISEGWMGLDIGPGTIGRFSQLIAPAKTIFWNGPMGVFEWDAFENGTRAVAKAIAANEGIKVAGGGDTIAAIKKYGLEDKFSHISTGGGASMELLEGKELPGVAVLPGPDS
jgi:phosphoglycerate kinase